MAARELVSLLVKSRALARENRWYRKTPAFITLLKSIKVTDRPEYAGEDVERF